MADPSFQRSRELARFEIRPDTAYSSGIFQMPIPVCGFFINHGRSCHHPPFSTGFQAAVIMRQGLCRRFQGLLTIRPLRKRSPSAQPRRIVATSVAGSDADTSPLRNGPQSLLMLGQFHRISASETCLLLCPSQRVSQSDIDRVTQSANFAVAVGSCPTLVRL